MASAASGVTDTVADTQIKWSADAHTLIFGPFAAGWADQALAFVSDKDVLIESVNLNCGTKTSTNPSDFTIFRGSISADTNLAGVITAGQEITTVTDLNDMTAGVNYPLTVDKTNNLLSAGEIMVLDTNTAAALAGLYIVMRVRYKLPN